MKVGIIIATNNPEKAWNAGRFGNAALAQKHEIKIFLMGAGVEIEKSKRNRWLPIIHNA